MGCGMGCHGMDAMCLCVCVADSPGAPFHFHSPPLPSKGLAIYHFAPGDELEKSPDALIGSQRHYRCSVCWLQRERARRSTDCAATVRYQVLYPVRSGRHSAATYYVAGVIVPKTTTVDLDSHC